MEEKKIKAICAYCGKDFEYRRTNSFKIRNMCSVTCARKKFASHKILDKQTLIKLHYYETTY